MKIMEKMQTTLDKGENKIGLMATTLQTLIRETSTKAPKICKGKYFNRDKKNNSSTSKEVHALCCNGKYTPIDTTYT